LEKELGGDARKPDGNVHISRGVTYLGEAEMLRKKKTGDECFTGGSLRGGELCETDAHGAMGGKESDILLLIVQLKKESSIREKRRKRRFPHPTEPAA